MTSRIRLGACVAAAALAFGFAARAEAPRTYAIKGARIVTVSGSPIQSGTALAHAGAYPVRWERRRSTASASRSSGVVREMRKKPSPLGP